VKDAPSVLKKYYPDYESVFANQNWKMFPTLGRIYVNEHARKALGWRPKYDFGTVLNRLRANHSVLSELASTIGAKGYHREPALL
jgi:UDP-glucose 4-epimerase